MYVTDSWHIALMVANKRAQDTGVRQRISTRKMWTAGIGNDYYFRATSWIVDEVGV